MRAGASSGLSDHEYERSLCHGELTRHASSVTGARSIGAPSRGESAMNAVAAGRVRGSLGNFRNSALRPVRSSEAELRGQAGRVCSSETTRRCYWASSRSASPWRGRRRAPAAAQACNQSTAESGVERRADRPSTARSWLFTSAAREQDFRRGRLTRGGRFDAGHGSGAGAGCGGGGGRGGCARRRARGRPERARRSPSGARPSRAGFDVAQRLQPLADRAVPRGALAARASRPFRRAEP